MHAPKLSSTPPRNRSKREELSNFYTAFELPTRSALIAIAHACVQCLGLVFVRKENQTRPLKTNVLDRDEKGGTTRLPPTA